MEEKPGRGAHRQKRLKRHTDQQLYKSYLNLNSKKPLNIHTHICKKNVKLLRHLMILRNYYLKILGRGCLGGARLNSGHDLTILGGSQAGIRVCIDSIEDT